MALKLKAFLGSIGKSQTDLAHAIGRSAAMVNLLVNQGWWPKKGTPDEWKARIRAALRKWTYDDAVLDGIFEEERPAPRGNAAQACPAKLWNDHEDDPMLLRNESLTHEARDHFGLPRSPFVDDINSLEDVFVCASTRRARAALMDAALNQGFVALVGESGSGKSTLREELEERIRIEQRPVVIITPYVTEADKGSRRGDGSRAKQIAEAIVHTMAPGDAPRQSAQGRSKQVHDLLINSKRAGYSHLLIIEEAHKWPRDTLRSLKSFMEMKDGLQRLLGVALIGQTELDAILNDKLPEVREIVQRCERREMLPLDDDLPAYLAHKFGRVGVKLAEILGDDACDAIRARLVRVPRGGTRAEAHSICHPLVVNNLVVRAMNAATAVKMPRVTADVIAGC